ncbi:hypothetical protein M8312_11910 [Sphingomonas sp. KRR8]|uniref:hypothetical protein n=1 Tax=Sphingomonas sp. KRR8 TaxID=2942996 RepID=UPI002020D2B1|nr:hypothetical protein [Sphingomonas sp. KRR8]URD60481.1 hypothetical protein M8312_11910 [Sphingomonas sp. KRR8]
MPGMFASYDPRMMAGGSVPSIGDLGASLSGTVRKRGLINVGGLSDVMQGNLAQMGSMPVEPQMPGGAPVQGAAMPQGGMFAGAPSLVGPNARQLGTGLPQLDDGGAHMNALLGQNAAIGQRRSDKRHEVLQAVANGLLSFSASQGNPAALAMLQDNLSRGKEDRAAKQRMAIYQAELEAKAHEPRTVGNSLVQQSADGSYTPLYTAPQPFEQYASALGYQPGTPEYTEAVKNYRLGAWNDDAVAAKQGLAGYRYDRMGELQDDRLAVTRRGQDLMHTDRQGTISATLHGQNLAHGDRVRGQDLVHGDRTATIQQRGQIAGQTDARIRGSAAYQGRSGRHSNAAGGGETYASNPNTGAQIVLRNGTWVDPKTGQPVH